MDAAPGRGSASTTGASDQTAAPGPLPPRLLRWGLPRDPEAGGHVTGFVVTALLTVVVTRGYLQLTGFPQIGGGTLHVAHVLWGGLAMAVAMVLLLSFAGPVIRPIAAFVGGIGFGLFIDEVGKFLTQDNDYFFTPAPMIMYVTLVLVMIGAGVLHGRRAHHPTEYLAGAADHAVAGLAGGLSERRRAIAAELLAQGRSAPGGAETEALLAAITADEDEILDPLDVARRRLGGATNAVAARWATLATTVLLVVLVLATPAILAVAGAQGNATPGWAGWGALAATALSAAVAVRGLVLVRRDRPRAFQWLRGAFLVNLMLTEVALFRVDPWLATAGLCVALAGLGVVVAEQHRLQRLHQVVAPPA